MRNEPRLPTKEELEEFKVKLKQPKDPKESTQLYNWPEEPSQDVQAAKLLKYRIAKHLVGYTAAGGRKVKRYGIHLLIGLFIFSVFTYGASRTPYFFDAMATFSFFFIVFLIVFYFGHFRPDWFPMIQEVRKGEEIPVAITDEEGKSKVITVKASASYTNVLRVEKESIDYLIPFGVIQEKSINNTPVWKIKHFHYNMVWGAAMYESYDTTKIDSWGEVISWMPAEIEDALESTQKYLSKEDYPQEEIDFVKEKIGEIYSAMSLIDINEKELNTRYGKRLVKIKRTKSNRAFFTAWAEIVRDIEAFHMSRLQTRKAANEQEAKIVKLVNKAKRVEIEREFDMLAMEDKIKTAMDTGYLLRDKQFHMPDQLAIEQDTASRAPDIRESEDIVKRAVDAKFKKMIEEGINGETDETQ